MINQLIRLLNLLWTTSMGLFLGLTAGTILAVVETFDSSRKINASPGTEPYADPRFSETANEVVAGFIAQNLFLVGGSVALVLLGIALLTRIISPILVAMNSRNRVGSINLSRLRLLGVIICAGLMLAGARNMMQMREAWPGLYEAEVAQVELDDRRAAFDLSHKMSERVVGGAWFVGLASLLISPWCIRLSDPTLQSGDGKESNQKENHKEEKA
jgi:hypothetical protein